MYTNLWPPLWDWKLTKCNIVRCEEFGRCARKIVSGSPRPRSASVHTALSFQGLVGSVNLSDTLLVSNFSDFAAARAGK